VNFSIFDINIFIIFTSDTSTISNLKLTGMKFDYLVLRASNFKNLTASSDILMITLH